MQQPGLKPGCLFSRPESVHLVGPIISIAEKMYIFRAGEPENSLWLTDYNCHISPVREQNSRICWLLGVVSVELSPGVAWLI